MKKKTVNCKVCFKAFERFASQPEGKYGWRCSSECIQKDARRRNAKLCVKCNRLCITTKTKVCAECKQTPVTTKCEFCDSVCTKTKSKKQFCNKYCRRKFLRRTSVTVCECKWCGKDFRRWMYATGEKDGGQYCSSHCKHSAKRLKSYIKQKSKAAAKHAAKVQINERWVRTRITEIEGKHQPKTEEQLWSQKIYSLCEANRHREAIALNHQIADWQRKERNQKNDWKYGGPWNRIVYLELKRLMRQQEQIQQQDCQWFLWITSVCSNQRKRMKRKHAAGCLHGE